MPVQINVRIEPAEPVCGGRLAFVVEAQSGVNAVIPCEVRFRLRNRWGEAVEQGRTPFFLRPGRSMRRVELFRPVPGGRHFLDVVLAQREVSLAWCVATFEAASRGRVLLLEPLARSVRAGGKVPVRVRFRSERAGYLRLTIFAGERRLYREERLVDGPGEHEFVCELPVKAEDGSVTVRAALYIGEVEADRRQTAPLTVLSADNR